MIFTEHPVPTNRHRVTELIVFRSIAGDRLGAASEDARGWSWWSRADGARRRYQVPTRSEALAAIRAALAAMPEDRR